MNRESIAVQVHTHGNAEVTSDTLKRVKSHLTDKIIVLCDKAGWKEIQSVKGAKKFCGFYHAHEASPYRNQILGLRQIYKLYPNCIWYGNVEWDTALNNEKILEDLEKADKMGCWTAGFDLREYDRPWPLLSSKIGIDVNSTRYNIGCLLFFHRDFIKVCEDGEFFSKILHASLIYGHNWPDYGEWSVDEAILPSIAASYGKPGYEFGCWDTQKNIENYFIRYKPDWKELPEGWAAAHPLKDMKLRMIDQKV